ncbi:dynein regulatory complex protein 10 isoform X1 [Echeneis naucrates]|nr:dynein regulatory complex protein 10 isoform X1 [Echeneis naucrates]XP_029366164.1 dynein regulatory complex protein 10 isoform X1 [Echeneis naucrates]XP_029366165.1 dynein regulatory complex protein 10 isoform X1 [Echeneis naucrates]
MSEKGATALVQTQLDDSPKIRKRSQKKQLSLEAQRISRTLENCIGQMEIVAALPAILHLNSESAVVDEDLSGLLRKHQILSDKLETLQGFKQKSEGEDEEARTRAKAQLEKEFKNSVRDLLRLVRAHPHAIFYLRSEGGMEVGECENKLIRELKMFHSHMSVKLLTSVQEEQQLIFQKPAPPSPPQNLQHIALQEEKITAARKEIDERIYLEKNEIIKLEHSLQENNPQEVSVSFAAKQPHIMLSEKQASMKQEMDQLNVQLNNLILENRRAEKALKETCEKVETEIEFLLQRFDAEMEENQAELELNTIENEREEEELSRLEKPFSVLEEEYNDILEKRQLAEEKREQEMRELALKTRTAILAQAWWRGYSTRKALKNKVKSKKAKKGKKK